MNAAPVVCASPAPAGCPPALPLLTGQCRIYYHVCMPIAPCLTLAAEVHSVLYCKSDMARPHEFQFSAHSLRRPDASAVEAMQGLGWVTTSGFFMMGDAGLWHATGLRPRLLGSAERSTCRLQGELPPPEFLGHVHKALGMQSAPVTPRNASWLTNF